ncbi:MAG: GNAT family N-acetyltransferase [Sphingomonadales bacterium]
MSNGEFRPPERLSPDHDLSSFSCGTAALDEWLRRRAFTNQDSGATRTYVILTGGRVAGYYALAVGAIDTADATGRTRRNMPDPVPVMVLARLAVDVDFQGYGLGRALLRDAILRTMQAADIAGIRALLVHAISDDARRFYERCGFQPSPSNPMTLMITLDDARRTLADIDPR